MDKKICATCRDEESHLQLCGRCKRIRYCSVECQRGGWKRHKSICEFLECKKHPVGNISFFLKNFIEITKEYYNIRKNKLVNNKAPLYIWIMINDYNKDFSDGTNEVKVTRQALDKEMQTKSNGIVRKLKLAKPNRCFIVFIPNRDIVALPWAIPGISGTNLTPESIDESIERGYQTSEEFDGEGFEKKVDILSGMNFENFS